MHIGTQSCFIDFYELSAWFVYHYLGMRSFVVAFEFRGVSHAMAKIRGYFNNKSDYKLGTATLDS